MHDRSLGAQGLAVLLVGIAMTTAFWGCSRTEDCTCRPCPEDECVLYSSSFESPADTLGWTGYGFRWLAGDAPGGGGSQAFGISGTCIWPHARYTLEPLGTGSHCTVRCWGRVVEGPGLVQLTVAGSYESVVTLVIEEQVWTPYSSSATIWCPAGESLEIDVSSGGFHGPGGVLVDQLEVVMIEC